jgi:hypothetical protein
MSTALRKSQNERPDYLKDLMDNVDLEWHSEFVSFVETGEANEAFLAYLDQNENAQLAVEGAFKRQAAKFEELATELKRRQVQSSPTDGHAGSAASATSNTSTRLAAVVENALQATSSERADVVATGTAALAASMPAEDAAVVKQVTRSLESNLAKVAKAAEV